MSASGVHDTTRTVKGTYSIVLYITSFLIIKTLRPALFSTSSGPIHYNPSQHHSIIQYNTMKTVAILALIAGTASAFTSSSVKSSTPTALATATMDDMVGAVDLRGKEFKFDPVRKTVALLANGMGSMELS